jgi:hypothetical protein
MKRGFWLNLFLILIGIVFGSMVSDMTSGIKALSWLSYGLDFGMKSPLVLDLNVLELTLGVSVKITIATVICTALALILGKLIIKK